MPANITAHPTPKNEIRSARRKPVAVFVCHGMGQQVHFETIEGVVNALLREQGKRTAEVPEQGEGKAEVKVSILKRLVARPPRAQQSAHAEAVRLCNRTVVRGCVTVGPEADSREVHVYEGYWAPLTEGKIKVWQVFGFLFSAARLGIWNCLRNRGFTRYMFDEKEVFKGIHLAGLTMLALILYFMLTLLVGPVMLVNGITLASVISLFFSKGPAQWINQPLVIAATWYVARIEGFLCAMTFALVVLPKLYLWLRRKMLLLRILGWLLRPACFALAFWSLAGAATAALSAARHLLRFAVQKSATGTSNVPVIVQSVPFEPWPHFFHIWLVRAVHSLAGFTELRYEYLRLALVWTMALAFGYFVRWFLIEFVGDVAIYTSGYKVSDFDEVRDRIRTTVLDAARVIYAAEDREAEKRAPMYDHVLVVGHSLGSVIAYDTLNSLLLEDLGVRDRTRLLLTFGSPLDKIAFVFRTHSTSTFDFREKAAEQLQLLIQNYRYRPMQWINIWSPMDIISGHLRFYDDTDQRRGGAKRVANYWDKEAWVPFAAHTEYWQNTLLGQKLYDTIQSLP